MPKDLDAYRAKRDFRKTSEPAPKTRSSQARSVDRASSAAFVVHRHEARRLHYDLRLEANGVLASWAVPRGFTYVPQEKRLAVRTEDHPLEYLEFSGVIPEGEYGAGTMTIWDQGTYELIGDAHSAGQLAAALERGKIELRFDGVRLRGEWHMVQTRDGWLLFKASDRYSRTVDDVAYPFHLRWDLAARADFPRSVQIARIDPDAHNEEAFSDPAWLFEPEFDGKRALAFKRGDEICVRSCGSRPYSLERIVGVRDAVRRLRATNAVLDGVIVSLDDNVRPTKERVELGLRGKLDTTLTFCAFDLLYYDAWNVRGLSLVERKQLLKSLIVKSSGMIQVDHVLGEGEKLCAVASRAGLRGVIAKPASGAYRRGAASGWKRIVLSPSATSTKANALETLASLHVSRNRRRRVTYSNLNKLYWPEAGYTKGDMIDYYEKVAEMLLPYLHDRPLHMRRFPDGIDGKSFYHHDARDRVPPWVKTAQLRGADDKEDKHYIICNDRDTLLYVANLGSIDLHPWLSRLSSLDVPDWCVFDLDPDGSPFADVVRVARETGKILRGIGLRPYLKTSGADGLHIYVPLVPRYTYEQVRTFGMGVARHLANRWPRLCTVERAVAQRRGRVYVDVLQNRSGQTVVPPYVLRPVPAASASTPLEWDELTTDLMPQRFNLESVPPRLAQVGDLFRGALSDQQELLPAIDAFRGLLRGDRSGTSDAT